MKVRLDFPFVGVLIILVHLVGETLTFDLVETNFINFQVVSNKFSLLVPVLAVFQIGGLVQCTNALSDSLGTISSPTDTEDQSHSELREPRLLKQLTLLNRQSCLSKILCGAEVATIPSSKTSTNDYSYLVKSFFDTLSSDSDDKREEKPNKNTGTTNKSRKDMDEQDKDSESNEDEEDGSKNLQTQIQRKNSKYSFDKELESLEDLVNEKDDFLFFKRHGKELEELKNCTTNCSESRDGGRKLGFFQSSGFMGYFNPRFDKTAFLDKKQLEIQQAKSNQQKLNIAAEVAEKFGNSRQCRLFNFLRPRYPATGKIAPKSNEPAMLEKVSGHVNSICPFTVGELRKMIVKAERAQNTSSTANENNSLVTQMVHKTTVKPFLASEQRHISNLNSEGPTKKPQSNTNPASTPVEKLKLLINGKNSDSEDDSQELRRPLPEWNKPKKNDGIKPNSLPSSHSKMTLRIQSRIRLAIPSMHGIAANIRKNVFGPQKITNHLDPNENLSIKLPEQKQFKRETNQPKQIKLKSHLEFQEAVIDQAIPDQVIRRPQKFNSNQNQRPPLPPLHSKLEKNEESEEDDEDDQEEDEEDLKDDSHDEGSVAQTSARQSHQSFRKPNENKASDLKTRNSQRPQSSSSPVAKPPSNTFDSTDNEGIFKHIFSPHGFRTLSTFKNMFYGSSNDEARPHVDLNNLPGPPPPPPRPPRPPRGYKKGPPPPRRRRKGPPRPRRPRPKPQNDESLEDDIDEEEDDESQESEEEKPKKKKKSTTTPKPRPPPLYPIQLPPRIVGVPIYLEGQETWMGEEKPHEEEFFEPTKNNNKPEKPDKYDYDSLESKETTNSAEGIDFGPGQKIQTEYSNIVDKVTKPGQKHPSHDQYVLGLPTTWEDIFEDYKRQKEKQNANQPKKPAPASASEESEEEEEDDEPPRHPRPSAFMVRPPTLPDPPINYYPVEPID